MNPTLEDIRREEWFACIDRERHKVTPRCGCCEDIILDKAYILHGEHYCDECVHGIRPYKNGFGWISEGTCWGCGEKVVDGGSICGKELCEECLEDMRVCV